jgi:GT2 family glycosyltransferase
MKISIDVIIPSFRLEEKYILPILQLKKPDAVIKFYLLVDNPSLQPSPAIISLADNENIFLLINNENIGAAETRNKGIAAGKGDWILFLDDDIIVNKDLLEIYADAIRQYPGEIGFIGLINFPEPISDFTKAIKASGSMDIFSIAQRKASFAWGATANTMVNRNAIGDVKFSAAYPKSGGGEDVDFFLKVRQRNNYKNFKTLPQAIVYHPWWNNGKPDFKRPFRYGKGNSNLGNMNPQHTYYDFLNTPETLLISSIVACVLLFVKPAWFIPTLIFMAGVLIIEIIASTIQTIKRYSKANLKVIVFVLWLRLAHESGLLLGKISKLQLWRIGERFHDDGKINKLYFYRTNTYKIAKWILYPPLILFILYKYI